MPPFYSLPEYDQWWRSHKSEALAAWASKKTCHVHDLIPQQALQIPGVDLLELLAQRLGKNQLVTCLDLAGHINSPLVGQTNGEWIKRSKMVGVNVRTIGTFWQLVRYTLTLPKHVQAIHILPIWEPGVVSSLYGMASWQINPEFFSKELAILQPHLDTVEKQLTVVVKILHALGKVVGMDVIPHTDRYSEIVLANPSYFEWLRRDDLQISDHRSNCYRRAEEAILIWLQFLGTADGSDTSLDADIFFKELTEAARLRALFGLPQDYLGRQSRRIRLVDHLYRMGLEPVPATMAPPYRGLEVDSDPAAMTIDTAGRIWRDYRISEPTEMSRVFGPLSRYQLYDRLNDNQNWQIDFDNPRPQVWDYVMEHYAAIQATYNFDFMRGDMSHVQMRPTGPLAAPDPFYDLLGSTKEYIQQTVPYFAYFAESFLVEDDYMGYGNEVQHLMASQAEVTLGNLQSMVPGQEEFLDHFQQYLQLHQEDLVRPCFTIITGDKDDPRFDEFYRWGIEARFFTALLLTDWPAYYSLGVEQRDVKWEPWANEYYTKLYVFQLQQGPKATHGSYRWGYNLELFHRLDWLHRFVESIWNEIEDAPTQWLLPPNSKSSHAVLAWLIADVYLCVVNFGALISPEVVLAEAKAIKLPSQHLFSTHGDPGQNLVEHDQKVSLPSLAPGEGRVWGSA